MKHPPFDPPMCCMADPQVTALDLLAAIDRLLAKLRKDWLRGTVAEQPRIWKLINEALDERLVIMAMK